MIFTSDLPNDQDMINALGGMAIPMPTLFTDCLFSGAGGDGEGILIAVERKKIQDMANSINNGRFLSQLQVCKEMGCEIMVLIVEGRCQANPLDGVLEVPGWNTALRRRSWHAAMPATMYSRFDQYLTELDYLAGVIVKRTHDVRETADVIKAIYVNFQKTPEDHGSLHKMFSAPNPESAVELARPGLVRRMAKELPSVGWEWSKVVSDRFPTVKAMCEAGVDEWASLEITHDGGKSRRLGMKVAERIVRALRRG